jgi:hypothetical protein
MSIMAENNSCTTGRPKMDVSSLDTALPLGTWLRAQPKPVAVMGC